MLFSGSTAIPTKKEVKKEKKIDRDEKLEVQENVFIRWLGSIVEDDVKDFKDLCDVRHLAAVAQLVTGNVISLSGSRYEDVNAVFLSLGEVKATPAEFLEGQQKAVLNTWWALVQLFWRRFGPPPINEEKVSEAIKTWCVETAKAYEETSIMDFTSSWRDGHCTLLSNPKSVSLSSVDAMSASERLEGAFSLAASKYGVPRLLHVKDLSSEGLDTRAVVTYLMYLYLSLLGRSNVGKVLQEGLQQSSTSTPSTGASSTLVASSFEGSVEGDPSSALVGSVVSASSATSVGGASTMTSASVASGVSTVPPTTPPHSGHISRRQQRELQQQLSQQKSIDHTRETPPSPSPHDLRSRKSSSSSQRSSKSRKARKDELSKEFEACLEHVLAWLLEAEEEVASLSDVESRDVLTVKRQFKEYEQLMASLTDSQETVGRVLHRGQVLLQRVDDETEKDQIQQQLVLVNTRWEQLRDLAMNRQSSLQCQLNSLQTSRISEIASWLTEMEKTIENMEPLADNAPDAMRQIEAHSILQSRIDEYQSTIDQLGNFVAVVDEDEESGASLAALEQRLASIGARWSAICDWSEKRASGLDGLSELCERTEEAYSGLEDWLKMREQELLGLRSVHHLETDEEIHEQVTALRSAREKLESEHNQLVNVSRLANEKVARLEIANGEGANKVRRRLDAITQRWENLVTRVEEHSTMLVHTGKVDRATVYGVERERRRSESQGADGAAKVIDRFVAHVAEMEQELAPLREWTTTFHVSKKPDQVRRMISVCQEKLVEIKEKEAGVARLQLELEHLHMAPRMSSRDLKTANDAFQQFNKGWAKVVTKISEALNVLSGQAEVGEEAEIAHGLEEWMEATQRLLSELAKVSSHDERMTRLDKLRAQLIVQRKNLALIERDAARKAILGKGLEILAKKMESMAELPPELKLLEEVEGEWSSVGDVGILEEEVTRSERLVEMARKADMASEVVEKAETRRAEMEERKRVTQTALTGLDAAENKLNDLRSRLDCSSGSSDEPPSSSNGGWKRLKELRKEMDQSDKLRKEAERAAEKMLAVDDGVPQENLSQRVDDDVSCAEREIKGKRVDGVLDHIEKSIAEFASDSTGDDGAVQELIGEWNRNEGGLKELEQLERLVREKGARGSEQLFLARRARADTLKEVLNGWQRTLQAMEDDEETLLLQVEQLHEDLEKKLDEAEAEEGKQLSQTLSFLRGARDRLFARARRLCSIKPRLSLNDFVGDVNNKFHRLEEKLEKHTDDRPAPLLEDEMKEDEEEKGDEDERKEKKAKKSFSSQIATLGERLGKARAHFDLDRYPVASVADWASRVEEVEAWLAGQRPSVEEAIMEGRRLAQSGSMELSTHAAIEQLDQIVDETQKNIKIDRVSECARSLGIRI